ncbi:JmjC domain-containing protein [Streptomyces klenkii]|uniref:JmjC domain-containing protein n=1 Tax=Streptomyces klenkii TaxID=1420899 RepID=UPI003437B9FE
MTPTEPTAAPTTVNWLERCVADTRHFLATHWRTAPAVLRPHDPPVDVLPLAELDRLLDHGLLKAPYINLVQEHGQLPAHRFCVPRVVLGEVVEDYADAGAVRALIRDERATLLLRYVDQWHAGVRALTTGVGDLLGRQVEAFYFLTPGGTQGRPVHRDDADVLAVQISGAKRWRVHGGPADGNWEPRREDGDPGPLLLDTVLRPGEVLYVPRGFAHRASAVGDAPSAHLSLTVREAGTAHLYALLQALLAEGPDLADRPLDEPALTDAAGTLLAHYRDVLATITPEGLVEQARAAMRGAPADSGPSAG